MMDEKAPVFGGIEMIRVEPGDFMMGSPENELGRGYDEKLHPVTIRDAFFLGKYPVTRGQYSGETGADADLPVTDVNWFEAKAFCEKLNTLYAADLPDGYIFDLPTEAQWEYACRAGSVSAIYSGEELTNENCCYKLVKIGFCLSGRPLAVGQKKPNARGFYDMSGNVSEWCRDGYEENYAACPEHLENQKDLPFRVRRGGSWYLGAQYCRSAARAYDAPSFRFSAIGFRLALVRKES